jgi:hypothetical protein
LEVSILEKYNQVTAEINGLVQTEPSRIIGQRKKIGVGQYIDEAKTRLPNEQHPRARLNERWVTIPETTERALAIDITREASFADITGDVMDVGGNVGNAVGYLRAITGIDMILGITSGYSFKGTSYSTYQTAVGAGNAPNNYVNEIVNPFTDNLTAMQITRKAFALLKDPLSQVPIVIEPRQSIAMPGFDLFMATILGAPNIRVGDGAGGTTATYANNPLLNGPPQIVSSPWIYKRVLDADGLNLAGANADKLWYWGDFPRAFGESENWPLGTQPAPAQSYQMLDQGIVASFFSNQRSAFFVKDPRYVMKNKNS